MEAELKWVHSPDIKDLESFVPERVDEFGFLLEAMIGPKGMDGEESFSIEICSPKWLEANYGVEEIVTGSHHLIVQEYNYYRLIKFIEDYIAMCSGHDWNEIATKLSRLGLWEFEDYKPM